MTSRDKSRRRAGRGVTLFEVLIVVAILAMLSGGIAIAAIKHASEARLKFARSEAGNIRQAAQAWAFEGGDGCPTVAELVSRDVVETNAAGKDPWRQDYRITCDETEIIVASSGPDRRPRTEDDIVVPARRAGAVPAAP